MSQPSLGTKYASGELRKLAQSRPASQVDCLDSALHGRRQLQNNVISNLASMCTGQPLAYSESSQPAPSYALGIEEQSS